MDFHSGFIVGGVTGVLGVRTRLPCSSHTEFRGFIGSSADSTLVFTALEVMDQQVCTVAAAVICFGIAVVVECIADFRCCIGFRRAMNSQIIGSTLGGTPSTYADSAAGTHTRDGIAVEESGGEVFVFLGIAVVVQPVAMNLYTRFIIAGVIRVFGVRAGLPRSADAEGGRFVGAVADSALVLTALGIVDQEISTVPSTVICFRIAVVVEGIANLGRRIGFCGTINSQGIGRALGRTPRAHSHTTCGCHPRNGRAVEQGGGEVFIGLGITVVVECIAMDLRTGLIIRGMVGVLCVCTTLP